jgi:hypothetical protein
METYADGSGKSGIRAYEISEDGKEITVEWKSGSHWTYPANDTVKNLAAEGQGLNAYINENLK